MFREVILLCDVEEASYREIAEILSIPMGTVMSRLARARKMVRGVTPQPRCPTTLENSLRALQRECMAMPEEEMVLPGLRPIADGSV